MNALSKTRTCNPLPYAQRLRSLGSFMLRSHETYTECNKKATALEEWEGEEILVGTILLPPFLSSRSRCRHLMCDYPHQDPSAFPFTFLQSKGLIIAYVPAVEESPTSLEHTPRTPQGNFSEREFTSCRILPSIFSSSRSRPARGGPMPLPEAR